MWVLTALPIWARVRHCLFKPEGAGPANRPRNLGIQPEPGENLATSLVLLGNSRGRAQRGKFAWPRPLTFRWSFSVWPRPPDAGARNPAPPRCSASGGRALTSRPSAATVASPYCPYCPPCTYYPDSCLVALESTRSDPGEVVTEQTGPGEKTGGSGAREERAAGRCGC